MARLTTTQRQSLPKTSFALPGNISKGPRGGKETRGAYPIPDKAHARDALARVSANGTPAEKATVRAKVKATYPSINVAKKGKA